MEVLRLATFALLLSTATLQPVEVISSNGDEESGYVEGDIVLKSQGYLKVAETNATLRWPNATIHYVISDAYNEDQRSNVLAAIHEFESVSCVKFSSKENSTVDYIHFRKIHGCSSEVGRQGGEQDISLEGPNCYFKGVIMHEIFHALGFWHEHNRPDRDRYVDIMWSNIQPGQETYFKKYENGSVELFNESYDYGSILHGSRTMLSRNASAELETIVPLDDDVNIGQRIGFSEKDIRKLNAYYNCNDPITTTNTVTSLPTSATKDPQVSTTGMYQPSTSYASPCILTTGLYYASDPVNCSRFYICVDGAEVQQQSCPPDLVFNVKLGVCDWPWACQCNVTSTTSV